MKKLTTVVITVFFLVLTACSQVTTTEPTPSPNATTAPQWNELPSAAKKELITTMTDAEFISKWNDTLVGQKDDLFKVLDEKQIKSIIYHNTDNLKSVWDILSLDNRVTLWFHLSDSDRTKLESEISAGDYKEVMNKYHALYDPQPTSEIIEEDVVIEEEPDSEDVWYEEEEFDFNQALAEQADPNSYWVRNNIDPDDAYFSEELMAGSMYGVEIIFMYYDEEDMERNKLMMDTLESVCGTTDSIVCMESTDDPEVDADNAITEAYNMAASSCEVYDLCGDAAFPMIYVTDLPWWDREIMGF